jgi:hypothetical protein
MIQIVPQMKILVAVEAVDGRKGIDSLARLCQEKLQEDPFSGCLFVFRSRRGTSIRILSYDLCSVFSNVQSFAHIEECRTVSGDRLHITDASEALQPLEGSLVLTPGRLAGAWQGLHAGDGVPLHVEIDGGISIRRAGAGVSQPLADGGQIYARL